METGKAVSLSYTRLALLGGGLLLVGVLAAEVPSLVQDLRFLHAARLYNEQQTALAAAQQQQQPARPAPASGHIDQSQVTPAPVPSPSPPKK